VKEDGPQIGGPFAPHLEARHIVSGILLQVEVDNAAKARRETAPRGRLSGRMIVADQQQDSC